MYIFLICLQVFAIIMAMHSVASILKFRLGLDARFLMLAAMMVVIYGVGYLMEMTAKSRETALTAVGFQYLGVSFMATLYVMFICEYCKVKLKNHLRIGMTVSDAVVFVVALFSGENKLLFRSTEWSEEGLYPHIEYEFGILFYLFLTTQLFSLGYAFYQIMIFRHKVEKASEKRQLTHLAIASVLPFAFVSIETLPWFHEYDPLSLCLCVTGALLTFFLTHWKFINVASRAYTSLFRDLSEGVIIADEDGKYLDSNASANMIFPEMKLWEAGQPLSDLPVNVCVFGRTEPFESNGKFFTSIAKPIIEQHKQVGYLIVISDVTEMVEQVDELEKLREEADTANKAKSTFLANMSHEIRTPMNAIIGMAELAEREKEPGKILEYVSQIKSAGKMLLDILCETLDLSKAESGRLELVPSEFDTLNLLNGVINVINMRIAEKPLDFIVDVNPEIPSRLYGDDIRIRQILINFLGNAEKYTKDGHIKLSVDFDIVDPKQILLKCAVEDTGSGISKEDMDKIFKPFSQQDMRKNRRIVGTGLGLAISATLLDMMFGKYHVESEHGKGSVFSFEIPLSVISADPIAPGCQRKEEKTEKFHTYTLYDIKEIIVDEPSEEKIEAYPNARVLVVDDNKVNVKVLCAFLKQFEIVPDFCYNGMDALKMVEEKDYDLIFMDHMMPEMDGSETTEKIRQSEKENNRVVPIIACSANVMKGADELFIESGMNDYISKPIQLGILTRKINKYLNKR